MVGTPIRRPKALAQRHSAARCRIDAQALDRPPTGSPIGDCVSAIRQRFPVCVLPSFLAIPTMMLSEAAAAATVGLIYSIGQIGGFVGNYAIGFLNDRTHSLAASFASIALVYATAGGLILTLRVRGPAGKSPGSPTGSPQAGRIVCEKGMVPSLDSGKSDG